MSRKREQDTDYFVHCKQCGKMVTTKKRAYILMRTNNHIQCPHCDKSNVFTNRDFEGLTINNKTKVTVDETYWHINTFKNGRWRISASQINSPQFKNVNMSAATADLLLEEARKRNIPRSRLLEYLIIKYVDQVPKEIF